MTGIPKETVTTTLLLVGIGLMFVVGMLVFAFSLLNRQSPLSGTSGGAGDGKYPTPTSEYTPNEPTQIPTPTGASGTGVQGGGIGLGL